MAAIEKVCEVSGIYVGSDMYKHKKNNIQVLPEYRKLFKGKDYTLIVNSVGDGDEIFITRATSFLLWVPEVPGQVDGFYYESYYDKSDFIKKMKKLLGVKQLKLYKFIRNREFIYTLRDPNIKFSTTNSIMVEFDKGNLKYKKL